MTDPIVADLQTMAEAANYQRWLFATFEPFLGQRILELGAGIGTYTELLRDRAYVLPTDIHRPCVDILRQRFGARWDPPAQFVDAADPAVIDLAPLRFDTVICFNVLEHVADDHAALRNIWRVLQPGGCLLLWVPAFPQLFGAADVALEHHRRYTKRTARSALEKAGFSLDLLRYQKTVGMPAWWLNGKLLNRSTQSARQVAIFDRFVVPWLRPLEERFPPPIGLSLVAVARKPKGG